MKLGQAFKLALSDVQRGRNVESYAAIVLATLVIFLTLFNVVSVRIALATLLSAAALTAILGLERVRSIDRIEGILRSMSHGSVMENFDDGDYTQFIATATRVTFVCLLNYRFLAANQGTLEAFLKRGGELRQMMMDINSKETLYSATARSKGTSSSEEHMKSQAQLTMDMLIDLAPEATTARPLIAKAMRYATAHVINWFEFDNLPGIIYVTPTGFHQRIEQRPTFVIREESDPLGYKYFSDYSENLWSWSESSTLDLSKS